MSEQPILLRTTKAGAQVWRIGDSIVRTSASSIRIIQQLAVEFEPALKRLATQ